MRFAPLFAVVVAGCAARAPAVRPMALHKVILYQNGIGYFERTGHVTGQSMTLPLARGELDDVLKTLTVIDRLGAGVATVDVPTASKSSTVDLGVRLAAGRVHDVTVSYAVPTPTWKAAYRVVLDDKQAALLQAWAMVNNTSQEDWNGVQLTLATGAPMSFALDLHTPQYVARPDATGRMVEPTVTGVITSENGSEYHDHDGDGILDADDKCPDDWGNGGDGCWNQPHAVVRTESSIIILQAAMFAKGDDALAPATRDIVDAVARTLAAYPDIEKVELQGNASSEEPDAWGIAMRRAQAVRAALVARGIDGRRVVAATYGSTKTKGATAEQDRRVDFVILKRREGDERSKLTPATVQASARAATKPAEVAGAVRYVLTDPVSIKKGASSMVSIVDKAVDASDVYLWRPEAAAPGSDRHPYRAVRLANTSGYTLEPGPVAIFARGTFVGDAILARLGVNETAWVPYALDGSTTVAVEGANTDKPVRVVSVHKGMVTVESSAVRTTTYKVSAGPDSEAVIWLRHPKAAGFAPVSVPAKAVDQGDAWLIPVPLTAGKVATLTMEERAPRTRALELQSARADELGAYLEGPLPAATAEALKGAIALRAELARLEVLELSLRERMNDVSARTTEIRQSLHALDRVQNADDLRRKLVASLASATVDIDGLAKKLAETGEQMATARAKLQDAIRDLEL